MVYFSLQIKKVIKNNISIIALGILLIVSFSVLSLNTMQNNSSTSLKGEIQGNIVMQKNVIAQDKQALKKYFPTGEEYRKTIIALKKEKEQLQKNQALLEHIKNNQWLAVYKAKISDINKSKTTDLNDKEQASIRETKKRYQYLIDHPMPYESDAAVTGNQLLSELNRSYWPILFTLAIITILTYLYTETYKNGLDTSAILPINKITNLSINSIAGLVISCVLFLLLSLLVFTGASLIFGTGNLQYPTNIYHLVNGQLTVAMVPLAALIPQFLVLQLLAFIFLVLFIQLLARLLHNQLPTLLLAVLIVIGMELAINVIVPFAQIAQWLPNTYLNPFKVVSGEFAYNLNNHQISFTSGVITLLISTLALLILIYLMDRFKSYRLKSVEEQ